MRRSRASPHPTETLNCGPPRYQQLYIASVYRDGFQRDISIPPGLVNESVTYNGQIHPQRNSAGFSGVPAEMNLAHYL